MKTGPWRPLLEGAPAERAALVVDRVAGGLPRLRSDSEDLVPDSSLAGGRAGEALFWSYLSRSKGGSAMDDSAFECLTAAVEELASLSSSPSLYAGFLGTAWAVGHLSDPHHGEDPNQEIDEALHRHLDRRSWPFDYELVQGLAGFAVYALDRLPDEMARRCLSRIVHHFAELAREGRGGLTWHTPPELIPDSFREDFPDGYHNLGVAHGVPGAVAVLAACCRAGVETSTARELLDGAVSWLIATRSELAGGLFPSFLAAGVPPHPGRSAWCYGNPGIAAALLAAARYVGEEEWEREALDIAHAAARRPIEKAGVRDAGLCHGSAGLAHVYNRIYQATGDAVCGQAARFWFEHTLESMRPEEWTIGLPSWMPDGADGLELREHGGFLTGASGVGLALLAATSPIPPEWDRVLLVSIPPLP